MSSLRILPFLVLGLALLMGCDSNESEPEPDASVFAVTGDFTSSVTGRALFATGADLPNPSPGHALFFYHVTSTDTTYVDLNRDGSNTLPGNGSYTLTTEQAAGQYQTFLYYGSATQSLLFGPTDGSLQITASSADVLRGTLSFDGAGFDFLGNDVEALAADVEVTFTARRATPQQMTDLGQLLDLEFH